MNERIRQLTCTSIVYNTVKYTTMTHYYNVLTHDIIQLFIYFKFEQNILFLNIIYTVDTRLMQMTVLENGLQWRNLIMNAVTMSADTWMWSDCFLKLHTPLLITTAGLVPCICKAYFNRLKYNTHRLHHLIPERRDVHYRLRNANVHPIPVTRTDRYKNSIVPWGLCNWQYVYLSA